MNVFISFEALTAISSNLFGISTKWEGYKAVETAKYHTTILLRACGIGTVVSSNHEAKTVTVQVDGEYITVHISKARDIWPANNEKVRFRKIVRRNGHVTAKEFTFRR